MFGLHCTINTTRFDSTNCVVGIATTLYSKNINKHAYISLAPQHNKF